ncbi:MAG: hypothetical protein JWP61_774 [Friedmanniella sp.]|nr:hypothetical protein [Friedmanniella sp.]
MTVTSTLALVLWAVLSVASVAVWVPPTVRGRPLLSRGPILVAAVVGLGVGTAGVALLAEITGPVPAPWSWLAVALAAAAAVLVGGAATFCVLALADASARPGPGRVQRTILRGGAWIGSLERLALLGILLAGWPEGLAAIVAVKAFARYPELKSGQATGAIERFIIGTFTSLGCAALCAGVARLFL